MNFQQVIPTHSRLKICCINCNKVFPEKEMFADLDVTNSYLCQECVNMLADQTNLLKKD